MLSYILAFITIFGVYLLGKKRLSGWIVCIIGNTSWTIYAVYTHQPGLALCNIALSLFQINGFRQWRKK